MSVMRRIFNIYMELTNVYSLVYCIFASVVSVYAIMFNKSEELFNTLLAATISYMAFSMPRHIIEYCHAKWTGWNFDPTKVNDPERARRKIKSGKQKALEHIIHHLAVIVTFYHLPEQEHNLSFCLRAYTKFHLFEISTIFITIISSPLLTSMFIGDSKRLDLIYKLAFMITFIGVRVCWLLPSLTFELYDHTFDGDYVWYLHLLVLATLFWGLHIVWTFKLLRKFVKDIRKHPIGPQYARQKVD